MKFKCRISQMALVVMVCLAFTSCNKIIMRYMGISNPTPKTDAEVKAYVTSKHLDYDYFIRPKDDSALYRMEKRMKIGFNSIVLYDNAGNEIGNTNDSTCHYSLRSQITKLLESDQYVSRLSTKNLREGLNSDMRCLACKDDAPIFSQPLKRYVLFFTVATFIPIKEKLSDLDYVDELKAKWLRDKVSVVLISADIH